MKNRELLKKVGFLLMAGVIAGTSVPVMAEETATEVITEAVTDTTAETEAAEEPPAGEGAADIQIPEVVPLEGEKTKIASGVIEKITRDIVVEAENKGQVEFFIYTPSDIHPTGSSTPAIMVYGDKSVTVSDAEAILTNSGLDEIAKAENCSIMFVNPADNEWSATDADAYLYTLIDLWSEEPGSQTGKTAAGDKIIGSTQRIYIIADGAGADFAIQYLTQDGLKKFNVFTDFYYLPAGVMLFQPTNEEVSCSFGMPAAIYGNNENLISAWKRINGIDGEEASEQGTLYTNSASSLKNFMAADVTKSYDKEAINTGWNQILSKVRRQLSDNENPNAYELLPVYDYTDYGILVNVDTADINGTPMEWYEYIPEETDMTAEGTAPLVFTFHGSGNHAEYQAIASEWPLVAKENGFMVVAVNQYDDRTAADIAELLELLTEKYPAIDTSRVYASGFSMGAVKSWELGMQYPELFAGIAPMDAVPEPTWELKNQIIPTYYLAGAEDGLLVFPHQAAFGGEGGEGNGDYIIQRLFEMNGVEYTGYDEALDPVWGMEFNETREVQTANPVHVITENYKTSEDGNTYTVLATMSNQAHAVISGSSYAAWDFLSQFSRNNDGSISIEP